jgi:hypothetical protein
MIGRIVFLVLAVAVGAVVYGHATRGRARRLDEMRRRAAWTTGTSPRAGPSTRQRRRKEVLDRRLVA